jgi:hypothetical protein
MLIINHSSATEAALRPAAFTAPMASDAVRDGVVLSTTWDLFRLGQRLLAGISPLDIRDMLSNPGVVPIK